MTDHGKYEHCGCGTVRTFSTSLIPQPWMQTKKHVPACCCRCGKSYYSFATKQAHNTKPAPTEDSDEVL